MTARTRSAGRMPRDVRARERLREAQEAEARAVTAVCAADVALAAASSVVTKAEEALAAKQASLVEISGLERAASLLGVERAVLRKAQAACAAREVNQ